jgi:sterol desaturase/sphingolipid hydroxylase (fatty acid hydroxylase superfamily)
MIEQWFYRIGNTWTLENLIYRLDWAIPYTLGLISILVLELFVVGWKRSSLGILLLGKRTHVFDGFAFLLFFFGIHRILCDVFFLGLFSYLVGITIKEPLIGQIGWQFSLPVQFIFGLILKDFLLYWSHRLKHSHPVIWKVHEFHHSSTQLTWFTSFRVHPLDMFVSTAIVHLPLQLLFGWSILDSLHFSLVSAFMGKLTHSRLDWDLGWLGRWILVSPRGHHLHHAIDARSGRNFADSFVFWDRIFGTYVAPTVSIEKVPQGIPENFYETDTFLLAYIRPVKDFYLRLIQPKYWKFRT